MNISFKKILYENITNARTYVFPEITLLVLYFLLNGIYYHRLKYESRISNVKLLC